MCLRVRKCVSYRRRIKRPSIVYMGLIEVKFLALWRRTARFTSLIKMVSCLALIPGPESINCFASTLDINDTNFVNRVDRFVAWDYVNNGNVPIDVETPDLIVAGSVENYGEIKADDEGYVGLYGVNILNDGTIDVVGGTIDMRAVDAVLGPLEESVQGTANVYSTDSMRGHAENTENGRIFGDLGNVNILGRAVNQNGFIRSIVTAQDGERGGDIRLYASDTVTLGPDSLTLALPSDDPTPQIPAFYQVYNGGDIDIVAERGRPHHGRS